MFHRPTTNRRKKKRGATRRLTCEPLEWRHVMSGTSPLNDMSAVQTTPADLPPISSQEEAMSSTAIDVARAHAQTSDTGALSVRAAASATDRTESRVTLRKHLFVPPHRRGDRDFKGNGPLVYVFAQLKIGQSGDLQTRLSMYAFEWKNGRYNGSTAAFGSSAWETAYRPPFGSRVVDIKTPTASFYMYLDRDHTLDSAYHHLPRNGLVHNYHLMGDTGDDDAGVRTGVTAHFHTARVVLERTTPPNRGQLVLASIPAQRYVPPHVRGDREFAGNGPRGEAYAELRINRFGHLQSRIFMVAEEWDRGQLKWDYTTSRGWSAWRTVYRPPAGKRVLWIHSPNSDRNRDGYYDTDHDVDVFSGRTGLVRQFRFVGDTNGNDAGTKTGVQVVFNRVLLQVG